MSDTERAPDRSVEGEPTNKMIVTQTEGGLTVEFVDLDRHPSWCKCQRVCGGDQ
jgi:hypothetical protein